MVYICQGFNMNKMSISMLCIPMLWAAVKLYAKACTLRQYRSWWRHQMETDSALLAICAGNSPVTGEFLAQRPLTRGFDVYFDLRLNRRLSKLSRGWWLEMPSRPWRRQRNVWYCYDVSNNCCFNFMEPPNMVNYNTHRTALEMIQCENDLCINYVWFTMENIIGNEVYLPTEQHIPITHDFCLTNYYHHFQQKRVTLTLTSWTPIHYSSQSWANHRNLKYRTLFTQVWKWRWSHQHVTGQDNETYYTSL